MLRRPALPPDGVRAKNLISIEDFRPADIHYIFELTKYYSGFLKSKVRPPQVMAGRTQINLFFESSTRTNLSFDLAGQKLGADVLNVPVSASSVNKDESLIDTAQTLAAMGADIMIVRHPEPRIHYMLAERMDCPVINAGDGVREHPTQALLDAATILSRFESLEGLVIAICGDVRHSRVARSDAALFEKLGANVRFVGPAALMPDADEFAQTPRFNSLSEGFAGADIVMALRMQFERMAAGRGRRRRRLFRDFRPHP